MRRPYLPLALVACLLAPACGQGSDRGVTLDFFQFKPEATAAFDTIIKSFEAEHPGIRVVQNHVPNAEAAIRTRLVKGDVPDVMTLNGASVFGELASAGVFRDFSKERVKDVVSPSIQRILNDLGTRAPGEVNGLPFASNAGGVIYNKDLFARHGVRPPSTWQELVAAAEKFKAAGVTPFYLTLKDAWTALPAFNALAASIPPQDFFAQRRAGKVTFAQAYQDVMAKLGQLFQYGQADRFSRGYDEGNRAFAEGKSAMYLQGSFAIPAIREIKPAFEIGTFALPAAEPPKLVSGVDVAVTMAREPAHPKEAMAFVEYLMRPEVMRAYAKEQVAVPPLKEARSEDPALQELMPYFEKGSLIGYPDHHIPLTIQLAPLLQQYLIDGDQQGFLREIDSEWDKAMERRS